MGYSIPAALGAKVAAPERQVVAVCGDGSFQMSMMELATMRQHNVPLKIVVFKNKYLGMVREYQHFTYKDKYSVVALNDYPDLGLISKAYDMDYFIIRNDEEIEEKVTSFLADTNASILEVMIDPENVVKG